MTNNIILINKKYKKGFLLVELSIALALMAMLAGAIIPSFIKSIQITAGEKTAKEITIIQEAARIYYIDHDTWPADLQVLQTNGYLNSAWVTNNPWSNAYSPSSTTNTYTVSTTLPAEWTQLVGSYLPSVVINGESISSSISRPGSSAIAEVRTGAIEMWATTTAPSGYLLCEGTAVSRTTYADLFNTIGTTFGAGDGSTTFNLPDFKGRLPIGVNSGTFNFIGKTGGQETVDLTHAHSAGSLSVPVQARLRGGSDAWSIAINPNPDNVPVQGSTGSSLGSTNILNPYVSVNFIIKY